MGSKPEIKEKGTRYFKTTIFTIMKKKLRVNWSASSYVIFTRSGIL